jgi:hypothetical protein
MSEVGACGCANRHAKSFSLDQQLIVAAQKGDNNSIERLLKKGAHIEAKTNSGR